MRLLCFCVDDGTVTGMAADNNRENEVLEQVVAVVIKGAHGDITNATCRALICHGIWSHKFVLSAMSCVNQMVDVLPC